MNEDERRLWERHEKARKDLILSYMPLVKLLAKRIARSAGWANLEDLVQDGVIGLIRAIERFNPDQGTPFRAFATPYICGTIYDGAELSRTIARNPEQLYRKIKRAEDDLTKALQRNPTIEEVAEETGLTVEQIQNAIDAMRLAFAEGFADAEESIQFGGIQRAEQERAAIIEDGIAQLDERQQKVIRLYYWENLTDKQIAAKLHLTLSNTTKLRQRAIVKLRRWLREDKKGGQDHDR